MNFLGRILTVFILIVSLLLMYVAITVYATHRNWKDDADSLKQKYDQAVATNQELTSRLQSLENTLKAESEDLRRQAAKLESERTVLTARNQALEEDLASIKQKSREDTAAVASTQENNEKLTLQVETLRKEIRDHQKKRDDAFKAMLTATDELHQVKGKADSLEERNLQLVADLGELNSALRENGIDLSGGPDAVVPEVRGQVLATRRKEGNQLIEVSIGSDDGIKPGQTVEVFRGDRYLGRAEILSTDPDKAVGRILRRFQQGQIQEGDNVATKLRV